MKHPVFLGVVLVPFLPFGPTAYGVENKQPSEDAAPAAAMEHHSMGGQRNGFCLLWALTGSSVLR